MKNTSTKNNLENIIVYDIAQRGKRSAGYDYSIFDYPHTHTHKHWEFLVVLEGKIKHTVNNKVKIMSRGDVCIVRPTDVHRYDFLNSNDKTHRNVSFYCTVDLCKKLVSPHFSYEKLAIGNDMLNFALDSISLENLQQKINHFTKFTGDDREKGVTILINSLLLNYFDYKLNYNDEFPSWLNDFLQLLNTPSSFQKSVKDLVSTTPLSHSGVAHAFKKHLGFPLIQYFNRIKMMHAKQLLLTTNLNMLEISIELGYDSLSTFNHNFKSTFGISPSEYKRIKSPQLK